MKDVLQKHSFIIIKIRNKFTFPVPCFLLGFFFISSPWVFRPPLLLSLRLSFSQLASFPAYIVINRAVRGLRLAESSPLLTRWLATRAYAINIACTWLVKARRGRDVPENRQGKNKASEKHSAESCRKWRQLSGNVTVQ